MPPELVARIQEQAAKVLAEPEVKQRLGVLGFDAKSSTPGEFAKFIDNQMTTYSKVIKDANIRTE